MREGESERRDKEEEIKNEGGPPGDHDAPVEGEKESHAVLNGGGNDVDDDGRDDENVTKKIRTKID